MVSTSASATFGWPTVKKPHKFIFKKIAYYRLSLNYDFNFFNRNKFFLSKYSWLKKYKNLLSIFDYWQSILKNINL